MDADRSPLDRDLRHLRHEAAERLVDGEAGRMPVRPKFFSVASRKYQINIDLPPEGGSACCLQREYGSYSDTSRRERAFC
jgi:hypothetical protein